jgi:uncharacterized domain HDIG
MAKVLCIDDEPLIRMTTCDYLTDIGHEVLEAECGEKGLALFHEHGPDVVLTDLRMPGGDGFFVVEQVAKTSPETPMIILSGAGNVGDAMKSLRLGAWDYLTKPVGDFDLLGRTIDRLLEKARDRAAARLYQSDLERRNRDMQGEIEHWSSSHAKTVRRLEMALHTSIDSLNQAVEEKDPYTAGHNKRVAKIATDIGRAMDMDRASLNTLFIAGLLHDIGKIRVPETILNKPSELTSEEYEQIKSHVTAGYRILEHIPFDGPVAEIVRQHHERYDGSGYPSGLAGEDIILEARIIAVADVYEALSSNRPYRARLNPADALAYVCEHSGTHFCPRCVDAFLARVAKAR